jgi:hypothetical protein
MFAPITTGPRGPETRIATAFAAAIALLGGSAQAEPLDELYAKAKLEQSLVIYAGGPVSITSPWRATSSAGFPDWL